MPLPEEPIDYLADARPNPRVYRVPVDSEGARRILEVEAFDEDHAVRLAEEYSWIVLESAAYDREARLN